MLKIYTTLVFLTLSGLLSLSAQTAARNEALPQRPEALDRALSLFGFGRWSDARMELLRARKDVALTDLATRMEIDYHLAAVAVELESRDADAALRDFESRYPGSVYGNDVRFSLASYHCARGEMAAARDYFSQVDRKALSLRRREQYDIRMGYIEFSAGNYTAAYDCFSQVNADSEYSDHALYYKSYIDYAEGRYDRAKQGFGRLAEGTAYAEVAPYYLLQIEFREGNYRYVVDNSDDLIARAVPERKAELERIVAESWFRLEEYNSTIVHIERFMAAGGELDRDGNYIMGFSLYRTVRYDRAAEYLRKACGAKDALTQNASYHLADCCLRRGDKQEAMQAFAMAADEGGDAAIAEDALFNYAKLQYELGGGAFNGAINLLTRYIGRYPSSERTAEARTLLIAAYYNSRNYDAAYEALKSQTHLDGELRAALQKIAYFRGLEAYRDGDLRAAQRYLAESAQINVSPKYTSLTTFWQGEIAFRQGDRTLAASKYNTYLRRAPQSEREYSMAIYNLGYCAFLGGDLKGAASRFEQFTQSYTTQDSYRADAFNRLGDVRYANRNFAAAVGEYDKAIALRTGEMHYARYKRAVTLGVMGRTAEKQQALQSIIAEGRGDWVDAASYELGRTYMSEGRYREGARQLERFVEKYPSSPHRLQALSDLGLAWLNLGDKAKSLKYYDMVVAQSPRSSEARSSMAAIRDIYVSDGDADGYFAYADRSGMESDASALSRDSLSFAAARSLYLDGKRDLAKKSLRSYIRSYPNGGYRVDALYYLGDCYLHDNEDDEAIETLLELSNEGTNRYSAQVLDRLSKMCFEKGRWDDAATAYRRLYDVTQTSSEREAAMTGYVRATVKLGDAAKLERMFADVTSAEDAGEIAVRESKFAWATHLRLEGRTAEAERIYRELARDVTSKEGSEAAYRLIEIIYLSGDREATEKAVFDFSERKPHAYWLAKAYIILGDNYLRKGDTFQARATWQSVADGYSPSNDGIVDEAREKISKLN